MNLFLLFMGCNGCAGCVPNPPNENEQVDTDKTDTEVDTIETGADTEDTAPPPPCAYPEIEPNNSVSGSNATLIERENWACGNLAYADFDHFQFEVDEESWIKVDVDAVVMGSAADPYMALTSSDGDRLTVYSDSDSTDPLAVFPVDGAATWTIMLKDPTSADPGDDYHYRLMASVTKAPVIWTHEESYDAGETLPWDNGQGVMEIEEGMVVLGGLDYILEHDWYVFQTPPDKHQIEVEIVAFSEGSPTNATLKLYDEDGAMNGVPLETVYTGLTAYDLDPLLDRSSDGDETWYLAVRDQDGSAYGPGYWYTIEVRVVD